MMRQRSLWIAVGGMAILLFGRELRAGTVIVGPHVSAGVVSHHLGIGVWIGAPAPLPDRRPPVHGRIFIPGPWHRRPVCVLPPHREVVVVRPPVVVAEGTITVWITNSNGSRTSVQLTRQGPWYIGPRGEYYADLPTNEQLRVVYGF